MATVTVTPGYNWVSGEVVTPAKMNLAAAPAVSVSAIVNADVADGAAIALSKLATGALPAAITVASANLVDGTIVNADISATAAIVGSKLADAGITTAKLADAAITAAKLDGAQTGSAPIYGCRAWVNFDGTRNAADDGASSNGNPVKLFASGNVSSVTRNSQANYTVTFSTEMSDANYVTLATGRRSNTGSIFGRIAEGSGLYSTSQVQLIFTASDGALVDVNKGCVAIFR